MTHVARDLGLAAGRAPAPRPSARASLTDHCAMPGDRLRLERARARDAGFRRVPPQSGHGCVDHAFDLGLLRREALLAAAGRRRRDRVVVGLALLARQLQAGADAAGAPAVLAVVGEHARVELGVAGAAGRAGALGREHLDARRARASACRPASRRAGRRAARSRCITPLPRSSALASSVAQLGFVRRRSTTRSPTGSSSVCSLKRSRRGHGSTGMNSPSTRRCVWPRALAHFARSV